VGHLDSAAGITGLIKTVLALENRKIPPSLFFNTPNPKIDFGNSPFYVNARLQAWNTNGVPRRAGVSSFGIGGTNAHLVLEEAPEPKRERAEETDRVLLLSARTATALNHMTLNLVNHLKKNPQPALRDIAYTLQVGRKAFEHRKALVCSSVPDAVAELDSPDSRRVHCHRLESLKNRPFIVFLFPGLGSHYAGMGRDLYRAGGVFKEEMDRCAEILLPILKEDTRDILYPAGQEPPDIEAEVLQPVLFAFEYALAKLLMHWGLRPDAMMGYSFGEYCAACVSGVLDLEDALALVVERSRLVSRAGGGAMMSVPAPVEQVKDLLPGTLSIAVDNGDSTIVSGPAEEIGGFEALLKQRKFLCTRLDTSQAIHSGMMDPLLEPFERAFDTIELHQPRIPYISNLTGNWIDGGQVTGAGYWLSHLRQTVQFSAGMKKLTEEHDNTLFIEVGPGRDLSTLAMRYLSGAKNSGAAVNLVRQPHQVMDDFYFLAGKMAHLWLRGANPDWRACYTHEPGTPARIPLPTYPFETKSYRVSGDLRLAARQGAVIQREQNRPGQDQAPVKKTNVADWFYIPYWKQSDLKYSAQSLREPKLAYNWLVLTGPSQASDKLGKEMIQHLEKMGHNVVVVKAGTRVSLQSSGVYTLRPGGAMGYELLLKDLREKRLLPDQVLHLWSLTGSRRKPAPVTGQSFENAQNTGLYSLVNLVKAMVSLKKSNDIRITVVSDHLQEVTGEERLEPEKSTLLSALKVISQEHANLSCRAVDIAGRAAEGRKNKALARRLIEECMAANIDPVVAYRGNHRWVQVFDPVAFDEPISELPVLREKGVYLVTGGLGGVGKILVEHLVMEVKARLVLISRSVPPEDDPWLKHLQESGGEVLTRRADVADFARMKQVLTEAENRFGPVNGVIHAAGVTAADSFKGIEELGNAEFETQFQAKVKGLLVLHRLFKDRGPDFCILTSSLAPVLGGVRFTAYAAANQFMDSFVRYSNRQSGTRWTSVNWADWDFSGHQARRGLGAAGAVLSMTPEEGVLSFRHILNHTHRGQIVVSAGDLQVRLDRWVNLTLLRKDEAGERLSGGEKEKEPALQERPPLLNPYLPPRNKIEKEVTRIWQRFFGFEVGIRDDFFELGGDSLKALTIVGRLHRDMNIEIPVSEMFKNPVIESIAEYISKGIVTRDEDIVLLLNKENAETDRKAFALPPIIGDGIVYKGLTRGIDEFAFYSFNYLLEEDKIDRYIDLMTTIQPEGPYVMLGYSAGGSLAFAIAKTMENMGMEVSDLIFLDVYRTGIDPVIGREEMEHFRKHIANHIERKQIDFESYKKRIVDRAEHYYNYARSLNDDGVVKANIHLIAGIDRPKEKYAEWQDATSGEYRVYKGTAAHNDLLDPQVIDKHIAMLIDILGTIG
jgi:acyl transferase domain-containing protein/thioesterase domain-containing protein/acyl carrier protein